MHYEQFTFIIMLSLSLNLQTKSEIKYMNSVIIIFMYGLFIKLKSWSRNYITA